MKTEQDREKEKGKIKLGEVEERRKGGHPATSHFAAGTTHGGRWHRPNHPSSHFGKTELIK